MRRLPVGFLASAVLIAGAVRAPLRAVDFTYLLVLQTEIAGRGQVGASPSPARRTRADEKAEFDRICGQVQAAPDLSVEELQLLIEDCNALAKRLEESENPQAKIWIQRLKMCKDFFQYSIDVMADD